MSLSCVLIQIQYINIIYHLAKVNLNAERLTWSQLKIKYSTQSFTLWPHPDPSKGSHLSASSQYHPSDVIDSVPLRAILLCTCQCSFSLAMTVWFRMALPKWLTALPCPSHQLGIARIWCNIGDNYTWNPIQTCKQTSSTHWQSLGINHNRHCRATVSWIWRAWLIWSSTEHKAMTLTHNPTSAIHPSTEPRYLPQIRSITMRSEACNMFMAIASRFPCVIFALVVQVSPYSNLSLCQDTSIISSIASIPWQSVV